jgi:hypothetical protein
MTSKSKLKGTRIENVIVALHKEAGIRCRRVPLSGALGGDFSGDLNIGPSLEFLGEVKSRKTGSGFKTISKWLGANDFLFLHSNYKRPMIVMTWETYQDMMIASLPKEDQNVQHPIRDNPR